MFSKEEFSAKTFIPVTYYGRNRWNSIFAQLLWTMNIFSVNAEGVQRCSKTVWRPKHKIWFNMQNKYNYVLICWFHHYFLTHTRPPACSFRLLLLYMFWYNNFNPIQSPNSKPLKSISTSPLTSKVSFALRNLIFRSLFAILADGLWL